jgi:hypothetical protein
MPLAAAYMGFSLLSAVLHISDPMAPGPDSTLRDFACARFLYRERVRRPSCGIPLTF